VGDMTEIILKTLDLFDHDLRKIFKDKYLDIVIHGSVTLNDFTPHRGDIDFIVILKEDMTKREIGEIFKLHDMYRSIDSNIDGILEYQLEGTYYPINVLRNINDDIVGCYIGTRRQGWKEITRFSHNVFDLIQIKSNGIYFRNGEYDIYEPGKDEIEKYIVAETENLRRLTAKDIIPSHAVIQFASRTMYFLETGSIGSKSKCCAIYSMKNDNSKVIEKCGKIKFQDNWKEFESEFQGHKAAAVKSLDDLMVMLNAAPMIPAA